MSRLLLLAATAYFGAGPWPSDPTPEVSVRYERGDRDHDMTVTAGGASATGERPWAWDQFVIRGGWPVTDNLNLYLDLGAGDLEGGTISAGGTFSFDGDAGFLYGGGFDYALPLGAFGPDVVVSLSGNLRAWSSSVAGGDLESVAGQFGPRVAARFADRAIVYGGISYTDQRIDLDGLSNLGRIGGTADAADRFGAFIGGTYDFDPNWRGLLEGAVAGDKRVDVGLAYRFGPRLRMAPARREASRREAEPARTYAPPPPREAPRPVEPPREARVPKPPPPRPERPSRPAMQPTAPPATPTSEAAVPLYQTQVVPAASVRPSEAAIERGNRAVALGRYQEAIVHYRQAVAVDPRNGRARYNLATAYYLSSDFASARAAYEASVQLLPSDPEVFLYLGFAEYRLGNLEGARRAWRRVLELDPANSVASNNLRVIGG